MTRIRSRIARKRRPFLFTLATLSAAAALLVPGLARAQSSAVEVETFEVFPGQEINILNQATSALVPHLRPSVGVTFQYAAETLVVKSTSSDGDVQERLIEGRLNAEVWAAMGLFDIGEIGLVMPMALYQFGDPLRVVGRPGDDIDGFALGDLRVVPKVRILDPSGFSGFGLAATAVVYVPTGDGESFHGDEAVRVEPRLIADYHSDFGLTVTLNLSYHIRPQRVIRDIVSDDFVRWGVGARYRLPFYERIAVLGTVYGNVGIEKSLDPDDPTQRASDLRSVPIEFMLGAQFDLPNDFGLQVAGGAGLTEGFGAPTWRLATTVLWAPQIHEEPVRDTDGDGLLDPEDACPLDPEDADGFEDTDGCPDLDNDKDGVLDVNDRCREVAEDEDGYADSDGCPDPDNDGDGIEDKLDGCPNEPETFNGFEDEDGCPDETTKQARVEEGQISFEGVILFESDQDVIRPESFPILQDVARVMRARADITLVQVEGHTDSVGATDHNQDLSQRRAEAVVEFLVREGVARERMVPKGFGESDPIAPNTTPDGREANRRVEFVIREMNGEATGQ